jgi:hypothetical protein
MNRYSADFVTTVATIAARAQKYTSTWHATRCVAFAWFSVNQHGDASIDDADFGRHIREYERICRDEGVDFHAEVDL